MEKNWKPNTTMNLSYLILSRVAEFLKDNPGQFLSPKIKKGKNSRNILIEKALTYYMDNWEEIKKAS